MNLMDIWHPLKACILITRKCNLQCDYCGVICRKTRDPELDFEGWKKVFETTKALGIGMNIIFGGEPMVRKDIGQIVQHLNENHLPYAFISNASFSPTSYEKLNLKNLSCSVDKIEGFNTKRHNELKSQKGVNLLLQMKGKIPDLLANMGLCSTNLRVVPDIVKFFSDHGIWVIMTPLHDGPESFWMYRRPGSHPNRIKPEHEKDLNWLCEQMIELKKTGHLVHQFENFFSYYLPTFGIHLNWHCKIPSHMTIDADGRLFCCIDFRGRRVNEYHVWDLLDPKKLEQFVQDFKEDVQECPGCCWDHIIESEHMYSENPDLGKENFQHHKIEIYK